MVYLETNKGITIDKLIRILQEAKADHGGKTRVLISVDDRYHDLGAVAAEFAEGGYGHWSWAGDPEEDEFMGDELVLSLYGE